MTIKLTQSVRHRGSVLAAGTIQTLETSIEADLVARNCATWLSNPADELSDKPVTAKTNPLTGKIKNSYGDRNVLADSIGQSRTRKLTKNLISRTKTYAPAADYTCCIAMELESAAISFKVGVPNIYASTVAGVKVSVAVTDAITATASTQYTPSTGTWVAVTFSGAASVTLPARIAAERPSLTFSDDIYMPTIDRLDGVKRPWVMVRIEYPSGAVLTIPYLGFYYWHTTGALGRKVYPYTQSGVLGVTTPAAFNAPSVAGANICIPAIQYTSLKQGRQVMCCGDSTVEGVGSTPSMFNATEYAAFEISTPEDPVEVFNAALHSQSPLTYVERINDLAAAVLPTHIVYSPYSVNGVTSGGMNATDVANYYKSFAKMLGYVNSLQAEILLLEGLPVNAAFKDVNANDSIRIGLNTELSKYIGGKMSVAGTYAASYSGAVDGDGQTTIASGFSDDNCHPNITAVSIISDPINAWLSAS